VVGQDGGAGWEEAGRVQAQASVIIGADDGGAGGVDHLWSVVGPLRAQGAWREKKQSNAGPANTQKTLSTT
jgi:hypothetical protein